MCFGTTENTKIKTWGINRIQSENETEIISFSASENLYQRLTDFAVDNELKVDQLKDFTRKLEKIDWIFSGLTRIEVVNELYPSCTKEKLQDLFDEVEISRISEMSGIDLMDFAHSLSYIKLVSTVPGENKFILWHE